MGIYLQAIMKRYIIQPSEKPNHWVCTDTDNGIICVFEAHRFNDTQQFTMLEDSRASVSELARIAREMGDWLRDNHYDKIF